MAIAHGIAVVPITFYDNKRRFPFNFNGGSPGPLRVKVHRFFETVNMDESDKPALRDKVRTVLLEELKKDASG